MEFEIIVLGSGPAGLAAAVAARGRGKRVLVVGNRWEDNPLTKSDWVGNYLGLPDLSGRELLERFEDHARQSGAELVAGRVISVMEWEGFALTVGSEMYQGKALVLAPGVVRQAKLPGEERLLGRGVSYCATCDGMLYRGKPVAVVGLSPDAPYEAAYLQSIGCQVTYISPRRPQKLPQELTWQEGRVLEVAGQQQVSALLVDGRELPCAGVFILRAAVAPTDLLPQLESRDGAIQVDRHMATSLPGVFAAGDCTGGPFQVAKAVGEGHVAGLSAAEYVDRLQKN